MTARPHRIHVPDAVLSDLHRRLDATRWPEPLPGGAWERGADVSYVRELCEYWRHRYDWRAHEAALNAFPQFLCEVEGVDLHFLHVRGKGPSALPLVLLHGWPGSIHEFLHLIGPLTDPGAHGGDPQDAFDVIIPSMPGYGFSGKPREPGWSAARIAAAVDRLLVEHLGYPRYAAQGGDWGAVVGTLLGMNHAPHVLGLHLNMVLAGPPPGEEGSAESVRALKELAAWQAAEAGYSHVQGTKPMSLGIAQSDSPAGLAAWIVEKFRTWSDCGGDVERVFSKDWLLTNLMFYWAPNSIASAANLYAELGELGPGLLTTPVKVPTGVAAFPREVAVGRAPRSWVERRYALRRYTEMPRGGHFAAVEQPELFLEDVRAFFRALR
ncbi:Epoxide hydrolase [Cystobacter fuscus DSM 2262]|uniref:Epoxide hydrolase n=1 Tax=Cystobacter fuscus (strain ATCC 25194 / DSM 2262 / NBRC 100088 / M29) TaxID=1242864 RepID=S9R550_CYSF2|nr:epoxide hydrolase [Cystobacter fuscus]EPX64058.1 Epoxide hydrolase [Cystobacter fuscus DSM 2262]